MRVRQMIDSTGLEYQFFQNYSFVSLRPKGEIREAVGSEVVAGGGAPMPTKNFAESPAPPGCRQVTVTGTYIPGYSISRRHW